MATSCGNDPANESNAGDSAAARPSWELQKGDDSYTGDIIFVNRRDGRLHIQLVNLDAVNFALRFPEEGAAQRNVETAFFSIGRGQDCHLVASDPPFQAILEVGASLKGTFSGYLGCPDGSGFEVTGSFEIPGE
jgi:hypothetical protein